MPGPSFRAGLIGGALAPLVVAALIQAAYSVVSQRHAAIDGLEAKARAVSNLLVDVVGPSIATDDPQAVGEGLGYFTDDSDFSFALAIAPDGKPLGYRGAAADEAAHVAAARITTAPEVQRIDDTLLASYPVVTGTKTIGEVVVGLRTRDVEAKAATLTTYAALFSLAGIVVAVLVVLMLVERIARRNREMTALLDNVEQGFVSIGPEGTLALERSAMATGMLGSYRPGQKLWEALAPLDPNAACWLELGWTGIQERALPMELLFDQLPKDLTVGDRVYRIDYKPSLVDDVVGNTLVVITEATADRARARAEAAERDLLRMIEKLTKDRAGFAEFIADTDALATRISAAVGQPITDELKRDLHTLKGNCGVFGLSSLADQCHQLETHFADELEVEAVATGKLLAAWAELKNKLETVFGNGASTDLDVRGEDVAGLRAALVRGDSTAALAQVQSWSLERVRPRLERFAEQARSVADKLGKPDLEVTIIDDGVRLCPLRVRELWASFGHVVRNAVDHGIEAPEDRIAAGKPARGRITLAAQRRGDAVVIELRDDGRGIAWDAVRAKADAAGLASATHEDLVAAILSDGMTTRDEVSEVSGRGVGLAALRVAVATAGGTIAVVSEAGHGTTFSIELPCPAPTQVADREVGHALVALYTNLRERVLERVRKVNAMTADAALQATKSLREVVAIVSGDEPLASIVAASHGALEALQTQDVCAQGLLQLDSWHAQALRDLATTLDISVDVAPEVAAISKETGILDHGRTTGEVMLFCSGSAP